MIPKEQVQEQAQKLHGFIDQKKFYPSFPEQNFCQAAYNLKLGEKEKTAYHLLAEKRKLSFIPIEIYQIEALSLRDEKGVTPLHISASKHSLEKVPFLHQVPVEAFIQPDDDFEIPLNIAISNGRLHEIPRKALCLSNLVQKKCILKHDQIISTMDPIRILLQPKNIYQIKQIPLSIIVRIVQTIYPPILPRIKQWDALYARIIQKEINRQKIIKGKNLLTNPI